MSTKRRTVINAEPRQVERAMVLVARGRYRTLSDFVREAMDEKLARVEEALLVDEVARYCAEGHAGEDADLITAQTVEQPPAKRGKRKVPRATR
jgi:Arc/MetJ-type ribon-helix-helix transcriptional regulator